MILSQGRIAFRPGISFAVPEIIQYGIITVIEGRESNSEVIFQGSAESCYNRMPIRFLPWRGTIYPFTAPSMIPFTMYRCRKG